MMYCMVQYEVVKKEGLKMIKATLNGETFSAEAGALHYMQGNVQLVAKSAGGVGGMFKAALGGQSIVRPQYSGTGEVFLGPPIFGEYNILELNGDGWVLDDGAYVCSDQGIKLDIIRNSLWTSTFGGESMFQTVVRGHGTVVYQSEGPVEEIILDNDTLSVDGSFAVARTESLEFSVERATKSFFGSKMSGEGFLNVMRGSGKVMLAPVPNRDVNLINQVRGIGGHIISRLSK